MSEALAGPDRVGASAPPVAPPVPGPRARYPGQYVKALATDKLGLMARLARHGDMTQIAIGPQKLVLVMHPDQIQRVLVTQQRSFQKGRALGRTKVLLGEGLLTSEGDVHLRQRRLVQPAFHRGRIVAYGETMTSLALAAQARWQDGATVDAHDEMMRLTLAIAGRTLFDVDVESDAHDIVEALDLSLRMFSYSILPLGSLLEHVPLPWVRTLHDARRRMDAIIYRLIADRRAHPGERGDLLSILVEARDLEGDGEGMSDQQLRDEIVTLIMAGHETTANALTWTWYLLSRHPKVEMRVHEELARVLGGRPPTADDLPALDYTRRVLAESMRLYPPAWILERSAVEDVEIGGHTITAGSLVLLPQYLVHRDPRWWEDPERFDPDRWDPRIQSLRPRFAYFPFGAGTRMCVGEHFAWMEATLVLATIAQRWRLRAEQSAAPLPEPLVTLRPRGGLPVRLIRRPDTE